MELGTFVLLIKISNLEFPLYYGIDTFTDMSSISFDFL